jgi:hypothetical protein
MKDINLRLLLINFGIFRGYYHEIEMDKIIVIDGFCPKLYETAIRKRHGLHFMHHTTEARGINLIYCLSIP